MSDIKSANEIEIIRKKQYSKFLKYLKIFCSNNGFYSCDYPSCKVSRGILIRNGFVVEESRKKCTDYHIQWKYATFGDALSMKELVEVGGVFPSEYFHLMMMVLILTKKKSSRLSIVLF